MENVTFIELLNSVNELVEYAIIDNGNEQFTSMTKAEYDRRQAEQSTPMVAPNE
jgi:hypothetical protein